jgi:hypothetical protein
MLTDWTSAESGLLLSRIGCALMQPEIYCAGRMIAPQKATFQPMCWLHGAWAEISWERYNMFLMRISDTAGAHGLIRIDGRRTQVFEAMIGELVCEELAELFNYWVNSNQCQDEVTRIFVYRQIHRELLAFFVCLTERFACRHGVDEAARFTDALADGVCEEAIVQSGYAPAVAPASTLHRALVICKRIDSLRSLHSYKAGERVVDAGLIRTTACAIALPLSVSPVPELQEDESQVLGRRLEQLGLLLLRMPPYVELAACASWQWLTFALDVVNVKEQLNDPARDKSGSLRALRQLGERSD